MKAQTVNVLEAGCTTVERAEAQGGLLHSRRAWVNCLLAARVYTNAMRAVQASRDSRLAQAEEVQQGDQVAVERVFAIACRILAWVGG